jgi:hypothetical protein
VLTGGVVNLKLGRREIQRLREELVAYTEAKTMIRDLVPEFEIRKAATALLYRLTGGTKWISPNRVRGIIEETRRAQSFIRT